MLNYLQKMTDYSLTQILFGLSETSLSSAQSHLADSGWECGCPCGHRRKRKEEKSKPVMKLLPQHWIKPSGEGSADHLIKQHGGNEGSKGVHFLQE